MDDTNDKKLKNVQFKIYKLSTFDFFTTEENEKYNEIKKNKGKMTEMDTEFKKFDGQRVLSSKALSQDNEIALFDSDLDIHVKKQVKKAVNNYKRNAMGGRILSYGFYAYLCPDLYAYCQRIFQRIEQPEGLIPDGYVYNSFYNDKKVYKCDLLRSPHLCNEHCIRNLIKTEECKKWFSGNDTIISCHDLTLLTLMADEDGDTAMVCTSRPILSSVCKSVPLYYKMFKAEPQQINTKNTYDSGRPP